MSGAPSVSEDRLVEEAARYRGNAVSKRSGFSVGAAIEDSEGRVWGGCNVENSTYGLTVCAERVAIWKALSEGVRSFRAVAVVTAADVTTARGRARDASAALRRLW